MKFGPMVVLVAGIYTGAFCQSVWTKQNSGDTNTLTSVAWSGKIIVAVGGGGTILTSLDGISWATQNSGTTGGLNSVIWADSQFVAVGDYGTVLTSPNGLAWTAQPIAVSTGFTLYSIAWSGTKYVAASNGGVGSGSGGIIVTVISAPNNLNWSNSTITNVIYKIIWADSQFIGVGSGSNYGGGNYMTSHDGVNWTLEIIGTSNTLTAVTWTDSLYVLVGYTSKAGLVQTSPDGVTWTAQNTSLVHALYSVIWSGYQLVSVGNDGYIATSPNGLNWSPQNSPTGNVLNSVVMAGNQFVAVGNGGTIITSQNTTSPILPKSSFQSTFSFHLSPTFLSFTLPNTFSNSSSTAAIYNLSGNRLIESPISKSNFSMHIGNLGMGKYFLQIKDSKDKVVEPFEINR